MDNELTEPVFFSPIRTPNYCWEALEWQKEKALKMMYRAIEEQDEKEYKWWQEKYVETEALRAVISTPENMQNTLERNRRRIKNG